MPQNNGQKNRDFIDFLVLLNNKKMVLLFMLPVIIGLGIYISINSLSTFSFEKKIQVAEENLFSEIVYYQMDLLETDSIYADKNPLFMSRRSSADLTDSSLNDIHFYDEMFQAYKNSFFYDENLDDDVVYNSLVKAIKYEVNSQTLTFKLKVSSNYEPLINFIETNIATILNNRVKKTFDEHLKSVTESALLVLKSRAEQDIILQKYELASLVSNSSDSKRNISSDILKNISIEDAKVVSSAWNKYVLATNKLLPDTNFNFFIQKPAKIHEVKGINIYFAIIFSIFLSIFIFFFYVLLYDLYDQVNQRVNPVFKE
tara:strand:- start:8564 stop:9508 length:945 start_codon:yes stop_codon:yes gene_type:complete